MELAGFSAMAFRCDAVATAAILWPGLERCTGLSWFEGTYVMRGYWPCWYLGGVLFAVSLPSIR